MQANISPGPEKENRPIADTMGGQSITTTQPEVYQSQQPLTSGIDEETLREDALAQAEHLQLACYSGVHSKTSHSLDIRSLFLKRSVAADPANAKPKLDARAIMLAAVSANTIILNRTEFEPDEMAMLATDFDDGDLSLQQVQSAALAFFGAHTIAALFSTASSQPNNRRWRLFTPMANPQPVSMWLRLQRGFAHYLKAQGLEIDATAERRKQLHFLPNVPWSITDKQGREVATRNPETGEPLHFEHVFWGTALCDPQALTDTARHTLAELDELDRAAEVERQQQAEAAARKRAERDELRQQALANGGDGMTTVERFNAAHELETLMAAYGYSEDPHKPGHWRSPLQTSGTFATQVREDGTWFSLSGSDAAAGLGTKQGSGVGGDAFDMYVHFEHQGHRARAVATYAQQLSVASTFHGVPPPTDIAAVGGAPLMLGGTKPTKLVADGKGGYQASKHNLIVALQTDDFCYSTRFDEFLGEVLIQEPGGQTWRQIREDDFFNCARCMEARDFRSISTTHMREAILAAAREQAFDSAKDWLNALPAWDGVDRIGVFLEQAFGVASNEYATAISRYVWSALAGRVLEPGVKADMVPVVAGRQGAGKSTVVKAIAPLDIGFGELNLAAKEEDLFRQMKGRLVMELPELSGMRKREAEDLKRFVASTTNVWIEKHQTTKTIYPRRCIFFGTTNETAILNDPTGSRRWLPFECGICNPQWVIDNRDQLWAQGAAIFKESGVQWEAAERLARDVHEDFRSSDPWEVQIARWLEATDVFGVAPESRNAITTAEVMTGLGIPANQQTRATEMRAGNALKALGYERTRVMIEGHRRYVYQKVLR
ncbi:MAG: hypothetical protein E6Q87_01470 [Cellvibrionales bacterium]|nr:MAG: hypothetical protein E6Q87_01470 [Cellvibrionales bacterium]